MSVARVATPPPESVFQAFGVTTPLERLIGGESRSYRAGDLVFKQVLDLQEVLWYEKLATQVNVDSIRLPQPARTRTGELTHEGWSAMHYLSGEHKPGLWSEKIALSRKFHTALSAVPKPDFISQVSHPWAVSDRMIWGQTPLTYGARLNKLMNPLQKLLRELHLPSQLIHGDMTGNILFHPTLPPAIIDFSPYWRPAEYASAIIITDALVWEGAPVSLLDALPNTPEANQLLIRATMWRIKTKEEFIKQYETKRSIDEVDAYTHLIDLLEGRVRKELSF